MVNLMNPSLPMAHPNTKSAATMHQPICCFVLCKSVWVIKCLSFFLVPSRSSNTPFYPQSAASQGACPNSLLFRCFTSYSHSSLSRSLGACHSFCFVFFRFCYVCYCVSFVGNMKLTNFVGFFTITLSLCFFFFKFYCVGFLFRYFFSIMKQTQIV